MTPGLGAVRRCTLRSSGTGCSVCQSSVVQHLAVGAHQRQLAKGISCSM
jgi:hypothetical protein